MATSDLPYIAKPVFFSFLTLMWGLGILSTFCNCWRYPGPVEGAFDYYRLWIHARGRQGVEALVQRLLVTVLIGLLECILIFKTLTRIYNAFEDPDVVANEGPKEIVMNIMVFWNMVAFGTLVHLTMVAVDMIVAIRCIVEHKLTCKNVDCQNDSDDDDDSNDGDRPSDVENFPLVRTGRTRVIDLNQPDSGSLAPEPPSEWQSDRSTLIPSTAGSDRSDSFATLCSEDSDFSSNVAEAGYEEPDEPPLSTSSTPLSVIEMERLRYAEETFRRYLDSTASRRNVVFSGNEYVLRPLSSPRQPVYMYPESFRDYPPQVPRPTLRRAVPLAQMMTSEATNTMQSMLSDADDEGEAEEPAFYELRDVSDVLHAEYFDADDEMDPDEESSESRRNRLAHVRDAWRGTPRMR